MSSLLDDWNEEVNSSSNKYKYRNRHSESDDDDWDDEDDEDEEDEYGRSSVQSTDSTKKDTSKPMFKLREHRLRLSKRKNITFTAMASGNGVMLLGSDDGIIYRNTVDNKVEEFPIDNVAVNAIFVDPSGGHAIICMDNDSNYYMHAGSSRPKKISKAQGLRISTIAWARDQNGTSASQLTLIGTDSGAVYEGIFDGREKHLRKVFQIANEGPIGGLQFESWKMPTGDSRYFVMLTTSGSGRRPTRLFQFIGGPDFESLFMPYTSPEKLSFQELHGEVAAASIHFFSKYEKEKACSFGVLTGEGVYHGDLTFGPSSTIDNIVSGSNLIPFPSTTRKKASRGDSSPLSFAITEFHVILLYPRSLVAINKLSGVIVYNSPLDRIGELVGLCYDSTLNATWIYSDQRINELVISEEDRDVWKLYMQKAETGSVRDFDIALLKCKTGEQKQQVLTAQADYYFKKQDYDRAAALYAKTSRSFEEVALRLIDAGKRDALKVFLKQKLKCLSSKDKTQKTVICTWMVELYLDQFNTLTDAASVDEQANLLFEFKQFLQDQKKFLDPATTFNLISSHGRSDELVFYANLVEDYEKVVTYHIQRGDYIAALDILRSAPVVKVEELYYKFSPELMQHCAKETVEAWKQAATLNASRLIPAIVKYTQGKSSKSRRADLAIDYLSFAVKKKNRDPTIHNYLLYLYAKHPDERQLIKFLKQMHGGEYLFDVTYALRLCTQQKKTSACIYIYSAMGLYHEAVEKALQVDVKIAKEIANEPEEEETRKKLWLLIAKHTLDAGGDIREAMGILKDTQLLHIEDILPFFPDFAIINDFKDEICESLERYSDRIDELKGEMRDYTESAELIRDDMKQLRQRVSYVSGSQQCDLSGENILDQDFYVFPCGHAFLASALRDEMAHHLNNFQRQHLLNLTSKQKSGSANDLLQLQLDDLIASECIYCGEVMIRSITLPFVSEDEPECRDWQL